MCDGKGDEGRADAMAPVRGESSESGYVEPIRWMCSDSSGSIILADVERLQPARDPADNSPLFLRFRLTIIASPSTCERRSRKVVVPDCHEGKT